MKLTRLFALTASLLLTGCEATGPATDDRTFCAGWAPVLIGQGDQITEATARQILAHNEFGKASGCW